MNTKVIPVLPSYIFPLTVNMVSKLVFYLFYRIYM